MATSFRIMSALYRIIFPIVIFWTFEERQYLSGDKQEWLRMHTELTYILLVIGTLLWILLMLFAEPIRETYNKYLRPKIKFVLTKHAEMGQFTVVDQRWSLNSITVQLDGYFENDGATPSMVKALEVQLVKRIGIFSRIIGRKTNRVSFGEPNKGVITDHRGYYVGEFWTSPIVWGTGTCQHKENSYKLDELDSRYYLRIMWHVKGQPIQNTIIHPDWDIFRRGVEVELQKPTPDKKDSQL